MFIKHGLFSCLLVFFFGQTINYVRLVNDGIGTHVVM